jgi:O-antigen ligase
LITVSIWFAYGAVQREFIFAKTKINGLLLIFILISAVSLFEAPSLTLGIKEEIKWIEMFLISSLVIGVTINKRYHRISGSIGMFQIPLSSYPKMVLGIILIAAMLQATIGIWQFALRGDGPDHFLILERFYRAFGTFQQPNPFGGFMGITGGLALGGLIGIAIQIIGNLQQGLRVTTRKWLWLLFLITATLLTGLGLIMSWSRGAWLGFSAGILVLIFLLPTKRWVGTLLLALGLLGAILFYQLDLMPSALTNRIDTINEDLQVTDVRGEHVTIENFAIVERLAHWQAGLNMARANLWTGVGFGNYEAAYTEYRLLNWEHPLGHAHNYYINILAETGVFGAIAYLLLWGYVFLDGIKLLGSVNWPERGIVLGLLTAWTALSVHHLFDKLYVNNLYLFFGVMLALQQVIRIKHDRAIR